ncbi:MAG: hypothetical protein PHE27_03745, partial [Alphaproteobacteria bacterium]|nr:hypothetical protein [Alphaproteobacteria bacterium]
MKSKQSLFKDAAVQMLKTRKRSILAHGFFMGLGVAVVASAMHAPMVSAFGAGAFIGSGIGQACLETRSIYKAKVRAQKYLANKLG